MALLAAPLVSEGEIYFVPPGRLARHQRKPERASVYIDATSLRVTDKTGDKVVTLADNPVLQLFVQSFVQILAGDQEALQATYAMQYRTEADGTWSLTLEPKLDPIDRIIERIELQGRDVVLSSMEVVEVGGDRTLTRFSRVDPRRTFSASELREIFGTPHD